MHSNKILTVAVLAASIPAFLSACSSPTGRGTEVTRFHLEQPIERQAVALEAGENVDVDSIEYGNYRQIVTAELNETGNQCC